MLNHCVSQNKFALVKNPDAWRSVGQPRRRLGALLAPALGAIDEAAAEGRIAEVGEAMAEVSAAAETIALIAFDASSEGTEVCQLVP